MRTFLLSPEKSSSTVLLHTLEYGICFGDSINSTLDIQVLGKYFYINEYYYADVNL